MKLIVVESPHKAQTISKYLGKDYKVIASAGHVRDLPENRTAIDVNNNFKPEYIIKPDKKQVVEKIKQEIKKADQVYLAGDPDREGEAISWHIAQVFNLDGDDIRIEFNEITERAVKEALTHPRGINMQLVDAQQARRVLDRLVGYELSPIISRKIKGGASAGRVQSVALKMIVDREKEIRNFKPEEYWNIFAFIDKVKNSGKSCKCEFTTLDTKKYKVKNKEIADAIISESKKGVWSIDNVKKAPSYSKAPAPFTTSSMQQDAINKLGFSATLVSRLAQSLYEGVEIQGLGHVALVTYIRTDSVRVSKEAQEAAVEHIEKNYGKEYVPSKLNVYTTKAGAQDAHEAIRPINLELTPQSLKDKMGRNELRLYKLIYDRFLASQMARAVYDTLTVSVTSTAGEHKYGYTLKGKTCSFKGYTAAYSQNDEKDEKILPNLEVGDEIKLLDITGEQKFTKPPARYNDGSIIKAMEENGIGRPATYTKIVSVLDLRKYIERVEKSIVPTELGELVCAQLEKDFPNIMDVKFTAEMELNLDKIANGEVKWYEVLYKFYPDFHKKVLAAKKDTGEKIAPKEVETDVICEKCGAHMVIRQGRFGKFLACPNYPTCKNTKPLESKAVAKCPECGSDIVKRFTKKNKPYYTCSAYPNCKFISWELPAPILCPECKSPMKIVEDKNTGKVTYICQNKDCKAIVVPKEQPNQEKEVTDPNANNNQE